MDLGPYFFAINSFKATFVYQAVSSPGDLIMLHITQERPDISL